MHPTVFPVTYPGLRIQRAEAEESKKMENPPCLALPLPSYTDLKWSGVIDQFQLCLERTRPFIHVLCGLFLCGQTAQALGETPLPSFSLLLQEDGKAVRILARCSSRAPVLWMLMDCLNARLSPCPHIVHSVGAQGAAPHSKVTVAYSYRRGPGTRLQYLGPPGGAGQVQS